MSRRSSLGGSGAVSTVTATPPIQSTGGANPVISIDSTVLMKTVMIAFANSPYTPAANTSMLVDTTGGVVSITLPVCTLGTVFEVVDYANNSATHHITVTPPLGWQLDDPNLLGSYQAANTAAALSINGSSCTWRSDGSAKLKALV
jgi:hypothetical protein